MKHFITGGSGFFGLHLINRLLNENQDIVVFDREELDASYRSRPGVTFIHGDVRDREALRTAMEGCDIVHHNAAVLPISRSGNVFREVNVDGTRNVLQASLAAGAKKVLFVSTSSVYGIPASVPVNEQTPLTPLGDYGWSKYEGEQVVKAFRSKHPLDVSIVRPRTIVGTGRLGIFGILFDWIRRGKRVYIIGKGDNLFQFLSAPDLAQACWLIANKPCHNEDFVLGAEVFGTYKSDLDALIRHAGTKARVQPTNARLVRTVLGFFDMLKISPLVDWHYKTPHKPFYFDITKAKTMLGWQPKDSNIAMYIETYDWYLKNHDRTDDQTGTTHRKNVKQGILRILRMFS